MNLPLLDGLRVIESSAFIAAPLAGLTLAQYGADVIRIDMIGGGIDYGRLPMAPGGRSLYWTGLNKGKRSLAVDLRRPAGRELVQALVTARGDAGGILLTNIPSGWLSHESLSRQRPDLVSCTIEGNPDGSSAVDYTVNASTGYPAMTGAGSVASPVNGPIPAWDIACAYQAAFAVAAAVTRRRRTGKGAEIRMALSDVAFSAVSHLGLFAEAELLEEERPALGNDVYGAFGRDFGTADGKRIMVAGISAGQWASLVAACGLDVGWLAWDEAKRFRLRHDIGAAVGRWIETRPMQEVENVFAEHKVCWGLYRTVKDLVANDPRVGESNPVFEPIETPGVGRHRTAGTPARLVGEARGRTPPAPWLGQHTEEILQQVLGLNDAQIGGMMKDGIVAGPEGDPFRT
jgi:2-methylfumaryl-CoA isomerase